jgi:hypothetical protein
MKSHQVVLGFLAGVGINISFLAIFYSWETSKQAGLNSGINTSLGLLFITFTLFL